MKTDPEPLPASELVILPPAYVFSRTELERLKFLRWMIATLRISEYPAAVRPVTGPRD